MFPLDGASTGRKEQCQVFLGQEPSLIVGFIGKPEKLVFPEATDALELEDISIFRFLIP